MPIHIFYNSLTRIKEEDNFKYDFYVSKSPSDGSALTTGPFYRLKTDNTGSGTTVGAGNFTYQFSGHGDKVTDFHSYDSENILDTPTRTYSSQILTKLQTADFAQNAEAMYPIFIFGCSNTSQFWTAGSTSNSLCIKKIRMTIELYNPAASNTNVNISSFTNNLFSLLAYQSKVSEQITGTGAFPQTINTLKAKATFGDANSINAFGGTNTIITNGINSSFGPHLSTFGSIVGQTKLVINYEADLDKLFTNIDSDTTNGAVFKLLLRLNNLAGTTANLDGVYMKVTSYVTILDQEFQQQGDKF